MAPPDPGAAARPLAPCLWKTFEHHTRIVPGALGEGWWRCDDCGTIGDGLDIYDQLAPLGALADQVHAETGRVPVILLPSESPPSKLGQFAGYDLYRVQGIDRPMVAI